MDKGKASITDRKGGGYYVKYHEDRHYGRYDGPTAEVYADDAWVYVVTDQYEGHAMINMKAIDKLITALSRVRKQRQKGQ